MKNIKNILSLGAACSLMLMVSACGSSGSKNSGGANSADTSVLDTNGSQYGQQPRDSTNTPAASGDSIKKTGTGKGNADPSGRPQND